MMNAIMVTKEVLQIKVEAEPDFASNVDL